MDRPLSRADRPFVTGSCAGCYLYTNSFPAFCALHRGLLCDDYTLFGRKSSDLDSCCPRSRGGLQCVVSDLSQAVLALLSLTLFLRTGATRVGCTKPLLTLFSPAPSGTTSAWRYSGPLRQPQNSRCHRRGQVCPSGRYAARGGLCSSCRRSTCCIPACDAAVRGRQIVPRDGALSARDQACAAFVDRTWRTWLPWNTAGAAYRRLELTTGRGLCVAGARREG